MQLDDRATPGCLCTPSSTPARRPGNPGLMGRDPMQRLDLAADQLTSHAPHVIAQPLANSSRSQPGFVKSHSIAEQAPQQACLTPHPCCIPGYDCHPRPSHHHKNSRQERDQDMADQHERDQYIAAFTGAPGEGRHASNQQHCCTADSAIRHSL